MTNDLRWLLTRVRPIDEAPSLRTVNGVGARLAGRLGLPDAGNVYLAGRWGTLFFIPIFPLGFYLVSGIDPYRFHGQIDFEDVEKVFGARAYQLVWSALIEGGVMLVVFFALAMAVDWIFARR